MANILIIDDELPICKILVRIMGNLGHEVEFALTLADGMRKNEAGKFQVIFLDVRLPDGNGIEALPRLKSAQSSPEVIIITGAGSKDGAEVAIMSGAWDYIEKPPSIGELTLSLNRALQYYKEKAASKPAIALKREGIVGESAPMRHCYDLLAQAAGSTANVLVSGESGTGKEIFSRAIHENSPRCGKNFVVVDCAALPETLVESVLFGHEKGAFTGADRKREGLISQADNGTLFLDEVGELPLEIQKKFLRVLQEKRYRPVGGKEEYTSDFRLIAATNRDLDEMADANEFRRDLLFRLRGITINLSPLREHPEDIKDLALYYVKKHCDEYRIGNKGVSPEFFEALDAYSWPGNVRELINSLETAFATAGHAQTLFAMHLPTHIRIHNIRDSVGKNTPAVLSGALDTEEWTSIPSLKEYRKTTADEAEKRYLMELLSSCRGNIGKTCRVSQLSRSRLYELLKQHGISIPV